MAGRANGRGSQPSSTSKSVKDRIKDAQNMRSTGSKSSKKGVATEGVKKFGGGANPRRVGQGGKGNNIITESVDNLIGGAFTKKSSGPRRVSREELAEKRNRPKSRQEANEEVRKAYRDSLIEKRKKAEESKAKQGTRLKPGGNREGVAPKRPTRVGIADKARPGGNQVDKVRGPKSRPTGTNENIGQTGGNVGPGGKGPNRTGGGPKSGIGQGGKRSGPPRQTGGNVGPGGKGPNRAGIGQGGKRGGPPRQTGGNVGPGGKGPNRTGLTEYGIL